MVVCTMREKWKHLPTQKQKQMRSWEPQQTKPRVYSLLPGQVATQVVVRCSSPSSRPCASFVSQRRRASAREGDARRDTVTRADTLKKPLTRTAAVLEGGRGGHAAKRNGLERTKQKTDTRQERKDDSFLSSLLPGLIETRGRRRWEMRACLSGAKRRK